MLSRLSDFWERWQHQTTKERWQNFEEIWFRLLVKLHSARKHDVYTFVGAYCYTCNKQIYLPSWSKDIESDAS